LSFELKQAIGQMRGLYYAFILYTHHTYSSGSVNYKTTTLNV